MLSSRAVPELEPVTDARRAELLLHPLRQSILQHAVGPVSAAEIARRIDLPAQRVNYHVRTLADAGFLVSAGERRKGNLVERRYQSSARAYVLLPAVLGDVSATHLTDPDELSGTYLLKLASDLQAELGGLLQRREEAAGPVPTLSMDVTFRFESADQRSQFAQALELAITDVVGRFTSPAFTPSGGTEPGRPFRLILGCYPSEPAPSGSIDQGPATAP